MMPCSTKTPIGRPFCNADAARYGRPAGRKGRTNYWPNTYEVFVPGEPEGPLRSTELTHRSGK